MENVNEQMLDVLKCVSCESYLCNKPVYIVHDGKNICHRCTHSNGVPKGAIRNLAYEQIATSIIFPCIYRFRGCTIRLQFGREMWGHENDCSYGQIRQKLIKQSSRIAKDSKEKERGVIETHSGHIWGTITPHSALFAPPKTRNHEGKIVTQELEEVMKKKQKEDEIKSFDSQSVDSIMSRPSTCDSTADNMSRSIGDNISRSTLDNMSRDNVSRSSARIPTQEEIYRPSVSGYARNQPGPIRIPRPNSPLGEVVPVPKPAGYNKIPFNGYHQDLSPQIEQYPYLYHFPPIYYENNLNVNHSASFNFNPNQNQQQIPPKRSESLRVGNQDLINELKIRQTRKESPTPPPPQKEPNPYEQCNNLQDIVQRHDEVFN